MAKTQVRSTNIEDGGVKRADLNVADVGSAVIRKLIEGSGVSLNSTGADAGTGDVTINAFGGGISYIYKDDTGGGDPTDGNVTFDNTDLSLATQLNLADIDADTNDLSAYIATFDDAFNPQGNKGYISMRNEADPSQFALFSISSGDVPNLNTADPAFDLGLDGLVLCAAVQTDGKLIIGGDFTTVLGVARNRIARLNADYTLDTSFDPDANSTVVSIAVQADGKILAGGSFTNIGGQTRNRIARLDATTGLADSFDPNANNSIKSIAVQADGKILAGGDFTNIGGQTRNRIARLDATTGLADSFDPNASAGYLQTIALQSNGMILVGGDFTNIGGQTRNRIARLDPTTGLADSFDPNADSVVYTVAVQTDGKIVAGGSFTNIGGQSRNGIARLDATTGLADSFNPNADNIIYAVAVRADGKILVGGQFTSIGGQTRNYIARLDATTGLADSFNPNANNIVYVMAVLPNDDIFVGGDFTSIGGSSLTGGGLLATAYHILVVENLVNSNGPFADGTPVRIEFSRTGDAGLSSVGAGYLANSTSNLNITGAVGNSRAFVIGIGKAYSVGARVRASSAADTTNWMEGRVTDYSISTLTLLIDKINGSGTHSDWNINLAGEPGANDATLDALAALTIVANSLTIGTGTDAFSQTAFASNTFPARASTGNLVAKTITDFGLSLVDDADAAAGRTTLGGTTLGQNFFTLTNPSAVTFPRINADNTVSALDAATFRGAIVGSGTVSMAMLADLAGLSIIGRSANTTGVPAAITGTAGQVLQVSGSGTTLGFGLVVAAGIATDAVTTVKILDANVTLAKMANLATSTLIGRVTGSTGVPEAITVGTGVLTFLQTPSSANLFTALTTKTGTTSNVVFSASPAFTGTVTGVNLTLTSSSNPMVIFSATTTGNFIGAFNCVAPNITADTCIQFTLGRATGNTNETGYVAYVWHANQSSLNRMCFGFWANDHVHNFYPSGGYFAGQQTLASGGADPGTGCIQAAGKIIAGAQIRLKGYTVSTLPAGTQGDTAFVTDALTPTFLVAAVGGGAVVSPVFYNGTGWVTY